MITARFNIISNFCYILFSYVIYEVMADRLAFVFKALLVVFVVIYVGSQFLSSFSSIDEIVGLIEDHTGADLDFIFSTEDEYEQADVGVDEVDEYINEEFYNVYYVTTILAALIGTLILSRMRNVYEIMGLLLAFIIPRKRKSWGSIIDKETNKEIPLAIIRLYKVTNGKLDNEQVIETVSDLDGKYRIHVEDTSAEYNVQVHASGYADFETELNYFDDPLETGNFIADIYLTREKDNENKTSNKITYLRPRLYWYVMLIMYLFSIVYFIFALYYYWAFPGSLYAIINIVLYSFAFVWNTLIVRERVRKPAGRILDFETKKPIDKANFQLYNKTSQLEVDMTDQFGIVQVNAPAGKYSARIIKSGYINVDKKGKQEENFIKIQIDEEGHLENNIFMKRVIEEVTLNGSNAPSSSDNPFS